MVKVREDQPVLQDGTIDIDKWLDNILVIAPYADRAALEEVCELGVQFDYVNSKTAWSEKVSSFRVGLEMAEILAGLNADTDTLVAAIIYRAVREEQTSLEFIKRKFSDDIAKIIEGVLRMAGISAAVNPSRKSVLGQKQRQLDNFRKLLVAMIDDVRVALVKLAERTCAIRAVKDASDERKSTVAREVFDIYAPLAHRLGVGQLKWELEDLAFRYLQPGAYTKIAGLLDGKRLAREEYIDDVILQVQNQLDKAGIEGDITGRVKHIYSIWRKMHKKNIDFYEVYDVRAIRILVNEIQDCYAVLGIVHALWQHVPNEFDDYIATPKDNGYQSIHTAVVGPERKMLEIQIRTFDMDDDAEMGVCAHWRYKEKPKQEKHVESYENKIAWLRQVLDWHDEMGQNGINNLLGELTRDENERVYVFTPEGHVVDLLSGSTPVDFAYQIHTMVGHCCRGAKIDGSIVPLNHKLVSGERVEIITAKDGGPSRDWLNPSLAYIKTASARGKVQQWFKRQDRDENLAQGKVILQRELKRLALSDVNLDKLSDELNFKTGNDILIALGAGDLRPAHVVNLIQDTFKPVQGELKLKVPKATDIKQPVDKGVVVQGVSDLLTTIANCCQPVPGEAILGYITLGRGVSVHNMSCKNLLHLQTEDPERVVEVGWGNTNEITFPVDIYVKAYDRHGLLKDVMLVLAKDDVNITTAHTETSKTEGTATILLTVEIASLGRLGKILARIDQLPNVIEVHRYKK